MTFDFCPCIPCLAGIAGRLALALAGDGMQGFLAGRGSQRQQQLPGFLPMIASSASTSIASGQGGSAAAHASHGAPPSA